MKIDLHMLRTTALRATQLEEQTTPILVQLRRVLIEHSRYLRAGVADRAELILAQPPLTRSRNVDPPARVVPPRSRGSNRRTLRALRAAVKMLAANRRLVNRVLAARAAEVRQQRQARAAEKAARRLEAPQKQLRMRIERILARRAETMARVKRKRSAADQYSMCLVLAQREKAKVLRCFDRVLYERLLARAAELRPHVRGAREGWAALPAEYAAAPDLVDVAAA